MRSRKFVLSAIVLAAATLTGSTVLPVTTAAEAASSLQVSGMVTTSGKAAPDVTVTIHAWPNQAVETALQVGQAVPWRKVGSVTTDATGHFSVNLPVASLAPMATNGVVNLEADSNDGSTTFPVVISRNGGNAFMPAVPAVHITQKGSTWVCHGTWTLAHKLGKHYATVGETYVPGNQATQQFTYSKGQTSVTGTGFSVSGDKGSFSNYGTTAVSATYKEPWGTYKAGRSYFYRTQFLTGEYHCSLGEGLYHGHLIQAYGYAGGAATSKPPSVPGTPKKDCVWQNKGSSPQSNNSSAVTWTKKLGINAGLKFEASSETGFDTSAQITYHFKYNGHECGHQTLPGADPKQLIVRNGNRKLY